MPTKSKGLLETSLYVPDVAASARFYERIFGFFIISDFGERGRADIVAVPGNPLDNIKVTQSVLFVMKEGTMCRNDRDPDFRKKR